MTEEEKPTAPVEVKEEAVKEEKKPIDEVKAESTEEKKENGDVKDRKSYKELAAENIKFDPSVLPESDDPAEIRKQVEFYFSDANLRFDKFLFQLVTFKNNYVPVSLIASFKRMKRFPNLETIKKALEESEFLELDESKEKVRRKVPLPEHQEAKKLGVDKRMPKSLYAKGFGEETPTSQVDIEKFFEPYGPIESVRLRRDENLKFKGSVFVEFANIDLLNKFMALDPKPQFPDHEITYMTKIEYVEMKAKEIAEGKIQPSRSRYKFDAYGQPGHGKGDKKGGNDRNGRHGGNRGGRGRGRGGRGRGGRQNGGDRNAEKKKEGESNGTKRAREDDGAETNGAEKKVRLEEAKAEVKTEA